MVVFPDSTCFFINIHHLSCDTFEMDVCVIETLQMKASSAAQFSSLSPEDVPRVPSAEIELFDWQNIFLKVTLAFLAKHPVLSHPLSE